jgi:hypothetical protein
MSVLFLSCAVATGALGGVALGALLDRVHTAWPARALAGALGGGAGAPLLATLAWWGRAPRSAEAATAGVDLATLLGMAASGALCGIVLTVLVSAWQSRARRRPAVD